MAGIYIHIPFCRQKCYYCDFYKTVNTSLAGSFISALKKETRLRKNYLDGEPVETIYFGGGTPSVLKEGELNEILSHLFHEFEVSPKAEITLEANPDDISFPYLQALLKSGINRLSVGIQSFQDDHLKKLNRRHNTQQVIKALENAVKTGFTNISADLIYGLPGLNINEWKQSLNEVFHLPVDHLSAYHLTYHEGTPFYTWLKKGTLKELDEQESVKQFNMLMDAAGKNGFEQYEISNFAKNEMYSKHNTSYWTGTKYLGLGPSAHSFNGVSRRWNVAHLEAYIRAIEKNTAFSREERLTAKEKFNEYILTRLRTKWGVSAETIKNEFGQERAAAFIEDTKKFLRSETMVQQNNVYTLTRKGLFVSDDIMADFMII